LDQSRNKEGLAETTNKPEVEMKRRCPFKILVIVAVSLTCLINAFAQSEGLPKFEGGAEFSSFNRPSAYSARTEYGFGGRLTYNVNRSVALEAAGYFFPHSCATDVVNLEISGLKFRCANDGSIIEGLYGVKAGKRFKKWGVFGKARPGFVSFGQGNFNTRVFYTGSFPQFHFNRETNFALDAGGVMEFYPSKRVVTRVDVGDTIIDYGRFIGTHHHLQIIAGVGFRF
jgi:hypothetical protein